ncbi:glycoside hydrolase family 5 protein [Gonapodya prolifera JEL478]|uniref:cellulase n=1 Tax=Gonapodya prolifera (strain JEL478) TaxID=1344416 RepID=A0A139AI41_GONPJ|nr:glycoside hydrolase family 5 protein [Gonapodya prolifera JEL478]|eukprot:KXS16408.1 glycoside hydrolase family 5 protein [Gonapodya prolifera JEL478]
MAIRLSSFITALILAFAAIATPALAARGRPHLNGKTFVADSGVPLRGPFTSTEWTPAVPAANIANMRNYNFNAVHLYAETFDPKYPAAGSQKPGYAATRVDQVVAATRAANMYVVIVLANGANNGKYNLAYARDFWTFYAARYKDETHVIYEIHNEPVQWGPPYITSTQSPGAVSMNADCYKIIRAVAPNTPVLLFTYASIGGGSSAAGAVRDIQSFNAAVFGNANAKWTNEAVAIHGYWGAQGASDAAKALNAAGFGVVLTEFAAATSPTSPNGGQDTQLTQFMEQQGVSWLTFLHIPPTGVSGDVTDPNQYTNRMNAAGVGFDRDPGLNAVASGQAAPVPVPAPAPSPAAPAPAPVPAAPRTTTRRPATSPSPRPPTPVPVPAPTSPSPKPVCG